jgi:Ca2+-transporting ATPase
LPGYALRIGEIVFAEVVIQVAIIFVGGTAFSVIRLPGRDWGISLALGVVSIPLGAIVRLLPNGPFEKLFELTRLLPTETVLPVVRHDAEWDSAITKLRDNLSLYGNIWSGRLNASARLREQMTSLVCSEA